MNPEPNEKVTDPMPETIADALAKFMELTYPDTPDNRSREMLAEAFEAGACMVVLLIGQLLKCRSALSALAAYQKLFEEASAISGKHIDADANKPPAPAQGGHV